MSINQNTLIIRQEAGRDHAVVNQLIATAFKNVVESDQSEHQLVARLRSSDAFIRELSQVAIINNEIVGHILLTKIFIVNQSKKHTSLALAPVSVLPEYQGKGIGGKLIISAHKKAKELGFNSIILLGHATYYPRFGYRPLAQWNIKLPFEAPADACMGIELVEGSLQHCSGVVEYAREFGG